MADLNSSGQKIARGVARHLARLNFTSLEEFVPHRGLRVDLIAIGPKVKFGLLSVNLDVRTLWRIKNGKVI